MRHLLLVVGVGVVALLGCQQPCGPGSCFGCCTSTGECVGSSVAHCGEDGVSCAECRGAEVCAAGVCLVRGGGSAGGGTASAGGSASAGGAAQAGGIATAGGFVTAGGVAGGGTGGGSVPSCPGQQERCANVCVDTQTDWSNCGQCGRRCGFGQACMAGQCVTQPCRPGDTCNFLDGGVGFCCDGSCKSPQSDVSACGGCGLSCPAAAAGAALCASGLCVPSCGADAGSCGPGTDCVEHNGRKACAITQCDARNENATCSLGGGREGRCCSGACVGLDSSPNCGACGVACTGTTQCLNRSCVTPANCTSAQVGTTCTNAAGQTGTCCDGVCKTNVTTTATDCRGCGLACPAGTSCGQFGCTTDAGTAVGCEASCGQGMSCVRQRCLRTDCTGASQGQTCGPFQNGACCGGACVDLGTSTQHCGACGRACGAGQFCAQGTCLAVQTCTVANEGAACPAGAGALGICCGGACVDARATAAHCGSCNAQCGVGASCSNAQCVRPDGGSSSCLGTDSDACPAETVCKNGRCAPLRCPPGATGGVCAFGVTSSGGQGTCCQGRCVDPSQDPANCNGCGRSCNTVCISGGLFNPGGGQCLPAAQGTGCFQTCMGGTVCINGSCQPATCGGGSSGICLTGNTIGACCGLFGTQCVDIRTDNNSCGGCGNVCRGTCVNGVCQTGGPTCPAGQLGRYCNPDAGTTFLCCGGSGCIDTTTSNDNCGGCGNQCGAGLSCVQGRCIAATCTAGTSMRPCTGADGGSGTCCSATCAELANDPQNCGQCGRLCAVGEVCTAGACALAMCTASTPGSPCHTTDAGVGLCCGSGCVATRTDPLNCGACNRQCPPDAGCVSGMCR